LSSAPAPVFPEDTWITKAHWTFNEMTGATITDLSGRGHDAPLPAQATWLASPDGGSVLMDGNECINVPDHNDFRLVDNWKVQALFRVDANDARWNASSSLILFSRGVLPNFPRHLSGIKLSSVHTYHKGSTAYEQFTTLPRDIRGEWVRVVYTMENGTLSHTINDTLLTSYPSFGLATDSPTALTTIGCWALSTEGNFVGAIGEIRVSTKF